MVQLLTGAQLQEQLDKSPSAFRITKELIESRIKSTEYIVWPQTTTTLCKIELDNGFSVIGHSACVDPKNFNKDVGQTIAHTNAFNQLWAHFGFMLSESLFAVKQQHSEFDFLEATGDASGA
jgi:hypothetical protein